MRELGHDFLADIGKAERRSMLARRIEAGDSAHMLRWTRATTRSILQLAVERDLISTDPTHFMVGRNAPSILKARSTKVKARCRDEAEHSVSEIQGDRLEALWISAGNEEDVDDASIDVGIANDSRAPFVPDSASCESRPM